MTTLPPRRVIGKRRGAGRIKAYPETHSASPNGCRCTPANARGEPCFHDASLRWSMQSKYVLNIDQAVEY
jgi:hypothetical protein